MPLSCPKCTGALAPIETAERIEVDFCQGCRGIWFDAGETGVWLELASDLPDLDASLASARPTDLSCPRCAGRFVEVPFSEGAGVLLDRCEGCAGLWFDAGEVPKAEAIAVRLDSPRSKVMRAFAHLAAHGYQVIGVRRA